jgi:hypothetical protein
MSSQIANAKLTDRPVIALFGMPSAATGLSASPASRLVPSARVRGERPTEASAVAAAAMAGAHVSCLAAAAANGAGTSSLAGGVAGANGYGEGQQKTQQFGKWAFRGLEPWSDPA